MSKTTFALVFGILLGVGIIGLKIWLWTCDCAPKWLLMIM